MPYPKNIQQVIDSLARLPGIGPKAAARIAFHLLYQSSDTRERLAGAIRDISANVVRCNRCRILAETDPCNICGDVRRTNELLCIIAKQQDLEALEKTHSYEGLYFLLRGAINALEDQGPEEVGIAELLQRLQTETIREVILALNPDMPGETTALYVKKAVEQINSKRTVDAQIKVSRLARGLPMGADVEYADEVTLENALRERRQM